MLDLAFEKCGAAVVVGGAQKLPEIKRCVLHFAGKLFGKGVLPTPVAVEPNEEAVREAVLRPTGTVPMLVRLVWLTGVLIICTLSPVVAETPCWLAS